ncbi:NOL1/NOP2/sun family putative RNA methylase [Candidatus Gracilibacteria bacterium]|nr:NOL1/NOP2/sun family putative RNA methylase [Candidatus Gracilibacteria bacterium]
MTDLQKFPDRFVERIKEILPKEEWEEFFIKATEPLPKTIRVSSNGSPDPAWQLKKVSSIPEAFFIERQNRDELPLGKTLEHFSGQIYIASLSSLLAVKVLDPHPKEKIMDLAAAPGSKTTFIADLMQNTGCLVCNEPSSSRSAKLASNLDRMGVMNNVVLQNDGSILNNFIDQEFDRILLDAPCSSEGYGRKDSDFFAKMWSESKIFEAAKLQKKLIVSAFEMLRSEGIMVYSTCTSAPEENEAVVEHLLEKFPEAELLPIDLGDIPHTKGLNKFFDQEFNPQISKNVCRLWPHLQTDTWNSETFFLAKIQKKSPLSRVPPNKHLIKNTTRIYKKNQSATVLTYLAKTFGIDRDHFTKKILLERNGDVFLTTKDAAQFAAKNPHRRCGLPIMDKNKNITSQFALHYGSLATKNFITISEPEKERWLAGYDLPVSISNEEIKDGQEILVRYEDLCLGNGKVQNGGMKLKNKLDRNLVF